MDPLRLNGSPPPLPSGNGSSTSSAAAAVTVLSEAPVDPQVFLASTDMFRGLPDLALKEVGAAIKWLHLLGGAVLMREGEPGDTLYLVVSGRLIAFLEADDGTEQPLREIGRGGNVGELALLTDEPRSASVRAVRDTLLASLSRARFQELLARHPVAMLPIARTLAQWIRYSHRTNSLGVAAGSLAFIPLGRDVPFEWLLERLCSSLATHGPTLRIDARFVTTHPPRGATKTELAYPVQGDTAAWLDELEIAHRFLVYQGDIESPAWTQRCVRQADRVVFVVTSRTSLSEARACAARLLGGTDSSRRREELVILHPDRSRPSGTAAWRALRSFSACHHVRTDDVRDLERLTRLLTGTSIGLVLSGGGARGFAHIGVLRALEEAGIPIDRIGGASMGAIIGAQYASGLSIAEIVELNRFWQRQKPHRKLTLPVISLVSRHVGATLAEHMFGDRLIEDLWLDYFCVSANLTQSRLCVHRDGPLARWVRASASIPGVAPPIQDDNGDLHVDGGLLDNMPADVMAELGAGCRIAVDVAPPEELPTEDYGEASAVQLGLRFLGAAVIPARPAPRVPNIFSVLYSSTLVGSRSLSERFKSEVDLYLKPPVASFGLFEWRALDRLVELGFQYARAQLATWDRPAVLKALAANGTAREGSGDVSHHLVEENNGQFVSR